MDEKLKALWDKYAHDPQFMTYDMGMVGIHPMIHSDVPSFLEMPIAWKKSELEGADAVILGCPYEGNRFQEMGWIESNGPYDDEPKPDAFSARWGASKAPDYVRRHSRRYSLSATGNYYPENDIRVMDHLKMLDYRNVDVDRWDVDVTAERTIEKVSDIVQAGAVPLVLGGDDILPYPVMRGISDNTKGNTGVIFFDSHHDNAYGGDLPYPYTNMGRLNEGNALYKVFDTCKVDPKNLVFIGIKGTVFNTPLTTKLWAEAGATVFTVDDDREQGMESVIARAMEIASKDTDGIYLHIDVDAMEPATFPAQKYCDPFGLTAWQVKDAINAVVQQTNLLAFSTAGTSPDYDYYGAGGLTACRFYMDVLKRLAIRKRDNK